LRESAEVPHSEPVAELDPAKPRPPQTKPAKPERRRVTVYLDKGLYEQARAAVLELGAGGKHPASVSALIDGALTRELRRLSKLHRDGEEWPHHKGGLPGGRPPRR
jgi:post-segregation antitoxin (ccd killing protein)